MKEKMNRAERNPKGRSKSMRSFPFLLILTDNSGGSKLSWSNRQTSMEKMEFKTGSKKTRKARVRNERETGRLDEWKSIHQLG